MRGKKRIVEEGWMGNAKDYIIVNNQSIINHSYKYSREKIYIMKGIIHISCLLPLML